jgi:L-asparagine transporter-like permease
VIVIVIIIVIVIVIVMVIVIDSNDRKTKEITNYYNEKRFINNNK